MEVVPGVGISFCVSLGLAGRVRIRPVVEKDALQEALAIGGHAGYRRSLPVHRLFRRTELIRQYSAKKYGCDDGRRQSDARHNEQFLVDDHGCCQRRWETIAESVALDVSKTVFFSVMRVDFGQQIEYERMPLRAHGFCPNTPFQWG